MAAPRLPHPSMIPVTVEIAFSLFCKVCYFPKSAIAAPAIVFPAPFKKTPKRKAINPINTLFYSSIIVTSSENIAANIILKTIIGVHLL